MKNIFLIAVLVLFCMTAISAFVQAEDIGAKVAAKVMSKSETEIRASNRALWESRAILLRAYILAAMNDSQDAAEAKKELLKNTRDLGASIQPYYGYFARSILIGLLKNDVALTGEVIKAAKFGNKINLDWSKKSWYANAFAVAGFFAITHNQTKEDLVKMFYTHLDLTWGEIDAILKKETAKDLEYYEKDRAHMIMVSNVLVNGLIKQFPERFKN